MKKTLTLLIAATLIAGCNQDSLLSDLKSPVILIGKYNGDMHSNIVLRDADGKILSMGGTDLARSIAMSREIGDTIK